MSPTRTPLRYPGGKQRLAPFIEEVLVCNGLRGAHYAEPYAGGAGVAIELLLSSSVDHVYLNDVSQHIYAFWSAVRDAPEELCRRISTASLTVDDWLAHREVVRNPGGHCAVDLGFSTFYLNRCNRSGVLSGGLIGGLKQQGKWLMDARFPRKRLVQRIEAIATKREAITVTNLDAEEFVTSFSDEHLPDNALIYCDPPYYERSRRLYLNSYEPDDHRRLAQLIQGSVRHSWLVSYDNHPDIIALYADRRHFCYGLRYSARRSYMGSEVFVFSDDLAIPTESRVATVHEALATVAKAT